MKSKQFQNMMQLTPMTENYADTKIEKYVLQQPLNLMLATVRQSVSASFCTVRAWRKDGSF